MAFHAPPEVTCMCECHGPHAGFYHCFGNECCAHPDAPRNDEFRKQREKDSKEHFALMIKRADLR